MSRAWAPWPGGVWADTDHATAEIRTRPSTISEWRLSREAMDVSFRRWRVWRGGGGGPHRPGGTPGGGGWGRGPPGDRLGFRRSAMFPGAWAGLEGGRVRNGAHGRP